VTNHFPIILTLLGTAACVFGAARRHRGAWTYGVVTLAFGAFAALPTWITGYQAHYIMETKLGLPEGIIEPHELLAEATMWIMIPLGALAAFAWWRAGEEPRRGPSPTWVRPAVLMAAVLGSIMLGVTAFFGGKIAHDQPPRPRSPGDSAAAAAHQSFQPVPLESPKVPGTGATPRK
jgi:uncharacterized membrane protein